MMNIKTVQIEGKALLAPMSNVTSLPFRLLCKGFGASLVYTEMVNCDAYLAESRSSQQRLLFLEEERPIAVQLMGSSVDLLKKAAVRLEKEVKPDIIDINIGCPAHNVMKGGSGASLLADPGQIAKIVSGISSAISLPLTCKMRVTPNDAKTVEIARIIEKNGASALAVHGRTVRQKYSGKADWNIIKSIKSELQIPVILNGDVSDAGAAGCALDLTGCDAVMVGRAAIANPYIFTQINHFLETGKQLPDMMLREKMDLFSTYLSLCCKHHYDDIAMIKYLANNLFKGFEGSKRMRHELSLCSDAAACTRIIEKALILDISHLQNAGT